MLKIDEKQYEKFSASERLNLVIAALSRDDQDELDRLRRTSQVFTYSARDLEYKDSFIAFTLVGMYFTELCTSLCHKIDLYTVSSLLFSLNPDHPDIINMNVAEKVKEFDAAILAHIGQLKAVYKGLDEFCFEIGLNSSDVIKSTNINDKCKSLEEYLSFDVELDENFVTDVKNNFLSYWIK